MVYVVDSEQESRRAVVQLVGELGFRCASFVNGARFLDGFKPAVSGCIVLELVLPDMSGFSLLNRIASLGRPAIPAIFLTSHSTVRSAVQAMRSGALHFLEKPVITDELREAIYEAVSLDGDRVTARHWQQQVRSRMECLTVKEEQVLQLIWAGESNRGIANALDVTVRTVELRRAKLMKKLGVDSVAQLQRLGQLDIWNDERIQSRDEKLRDVVSARL